MGSVNGGIFCSDDQYCFKTDCVTQQLATVRLGIDQLQDLARNAIHYSGEYFKVMEKNMSVPVNNYNTSIFSLYDSQCYENNKIPGIYQINYGLMVGVRNGNLVTGHILGNFYGQLLKRLDLLLESFKSKCVPKPEDLTADYPKWLPAFAFELPRETLIQDFIFPTPPQLQ